MTRVDAVTLLVATSAVVVFLAVFCVAFSEWVIR